MRVVARRDVGAGRRRSGGGTLRVSVWVLHVALPLAALWLLVARPEVDLRWEDHPAHFWLVLLVALVNVGLALRMSADARRRADARLFLVAAAFAGSAAFFALHALATPGVLLDASNRGFEYATPVGMLVATVLVAASSVELTPRAAAFVLRWRGAVLGAVAAAALAWGAVSLAGLPPLSGSPGAGERRAVLGGLAAVGAGLYAVAAWQYWRMFRRRPSVMGLSLITAFVLLAEAMVATVYARNWQASWWEWHLLLVAAFGFVAYSARVQQHREGTRKGLFTSVALDDTIAALQRDLGAALESLVDAMQRRAEDATDEPVGALAASVAGRFGLTERQADVLERSAEALLHEREQLRRLAALVAVGQEASVVRAEPDLLARAVRIVRDALGRDRLRLTVLRDGRLEAVDGDGAEAADGGGAGGGDDAELRQRAVHDKEVVEAAAGDGAVMVVPLMVKGRPTGTLEVRREHGGFADRDRWVLRSLASQLAITLENARLYREIEGLFRSYMSPDVAAALLADPARARLGGVIREVTVLMADLRGYTPYSERTEPDDVVAMLNAYYGAVVPVILAEGGTVVQFVGDAVMAVFNAPAPQPDHPLRAARAALAMQAETERVAAGRRDWPRFRIGVNTGPALVGNVGSETLRNFTAIGDTTNVAARLQSIADVGTVVVGAGTWSAIRDAADGQPLGPVEVKGRDEAVEAYLLTAMER